MTNIASLIGKPWAVPCSPPDSFECWELVRHVRNMHGIETPSVVDHLTRKPGDRQHFENPPAEWRQLDKPTLFCVVRFGSKHVGAYLGRNRVIHSAFALGVRIDNLNAIPQDVTYWEMRNVS